MSAMIPHSLERWSREKMAFKKRSTCSGSGTGDALRRRRWEQAEMGIQLNVTGISTKYCRRTTIQEFNAKSTNDYKPMASILQWSISNWSFCKSSSSWMESGMIGASHIWRWITRLTLRIETSELGIDNVSTSSIVASWTPYNADSQHTHTHSLSLYINDDMETKTFFSVIDEWCKPKLRHWVSQFHFSSFHASRWVGVRLRLNWKKKKHTHTKQTISSYAQLLSKAHSAHSPVFRTLWMGLSQFTNWQLVSPATSKHEIYILLYTGMMAGIVKHERRCFKCKREVLWAKRKTRLIMSKKTHSEIWRRESDHWRFLFFWNLWYRLRKSKSEYFCRVERVFDSLLRKRFGWRPSSVHK